MAQMLRLSSLRFGLLQAVVLGVLLLAPLVWARVAERRAKLPELQRGPTHVGPLYNEPLMVSDEQLTAVLDKLQPRFRGVAKPSINYIDHALRFWGSQAVFTDSASLSGREMRKLLTDHQAFVASWGDKQRPLLVDGPAGPRYRTQQGQASASHVDHTLATLAEIGTPLAFPLRLKDRQTTVEALLQQALLSFDINQVEYEWTILAAALYAVDGQSWYSADGERLDFDRLAQRLMRQQLGQGVCFGNHRLYTLTILLRLQPEKHLLSDATQAAVEQYLGDVTRRLVASQSRDGYWDKTWPVVTDGPVEKADERLDATARRLLATGHALEWWAMAPVELHPPREVLIRAAQWLVVEVDKLSAAKVQEDYPFLSHVGRSLALWRGGLPTRYTQTAKTVPGAAAPSEATAPETETKHDLEVETERSKS